MAYQRPNIVSGVTKATKAFFENIFDGLDEAAERDEAFSEGLNGKLSKADADANYANVDAYVIFRDQDGDELPEGSVVEIRVNTATSEIDDIIYTAPEA